jgi:hypothetical protein
MGENALFDLSSAHLQGNRSQWSPIDVLASTVARVRLTQWRSRAYAPFLAAATGTALSLGSCSTPSGSGPVLPPAPQELVVTMREYRFDYSPPQGAGRVVFRAHNAGQEEHDLALIPLAEDIPPIDEQLRGQVRRVITPFARIPPRPPGGRGAFAVDLVPGQRYALVCFVAGPDGQAHALKGMNAEFRAEGARQGATVGSAGGR